MLDNEDVLYNDGKSDGNGNDDENYNDRSNRLELFLEISQNSQENTCARVYRTPPVAASEMKIFSFLRCQRNLRYLR